VVIGDHQDLHPGLLQCRDGLRRGRAIVSVSRSRPTC
jgi:hypothetical protein